MQKFHMKYRDDLVTDNSVSFSIDLNVVYF